ncbi:MAG TPA: Yip1 family protein [Usitatibacter sp.]|nr:Yip1 family protein [Usitatibacter sp.]
MNIVERAKNILLSPATEWDKVAAETTAPKDVVINYVIPLAALAAVAHFVSMVVIGTRMPFVGTYHMGAVWGLVAAVYHFVMAIVGVFVIAFITDALAPSFGGTKDMNQAVKLTAYTFTASWVGAVFGIIPFIGWLIALLIGLYGLYILYLGLPKLMKNPADKTIVYEIVLIIVAIIVFVVIGAIGSVLTAGGMIGAGAMGGMGMGSRHSEVTLDPNSPLAKYSKNLDEASKQMEAAQKSGDSSKQMAAAMGAINAAMGGKGVDPVQTDALKPFIPDSFAGLPRKDMSTERGGVQGMMTAKARGVYNDGAGKSATLEVVDSGGAAGLVGLAGWAGLQAEKEDSNHKESTRKENGRLVHERLDKPSNYGEFTVVLADRFIVTAKGNVGLDGLKAGVGSLDLGKIESLK